MRPLRLEMEGFLAYRDRAVVDFADADLFVLAGSTGSGKSSVIDAMTFALYGTIPRLGHRSAVAPVINATCDVARVQFEFSIDDQTYQVARRVERTKGGAQVTEARLQQNEKILESGSKEVTGAVTELLGLGFEHFTKAVVLPQGAFADFLTDTPKERQNLLRALLDLGLFERIKVVANERASIAKGRVDTLEENLAKLDVPGAEELAAAETRLSILAVALKELPARMEKVESLRVVSVEAEKRRHELASRLEMLRHAALPDDLVTLKDLATESKAKLAAQKKAVDRLTAREGTLVSEVETMPARSDLERWLDGRTRLSALHTAKDALDLEGLARKLADIDRSVGELRGVYETQVAAHAAHGLRQNLEPGEPCPVCARDVVEVPDSDDVNASTSEEARRLLEAEEMSANTARRLLAEAQGQDHQLSERIAELDERQADAPTSEKMTSTLKALQGLADELGQVEKELSVVRGEYEKLLVSSESVEQTTKELGVRLYEAMAGVTREDPPAPPDDVLEGWGQFETWRVIKAEVLEADLVEAAAAVGRSEATLAGAGVELGSWLSSLDVESEDSYRTDLALAVERKRTEVAAMVDTVETAKATTKQIKDESKLARVASALGNHLKSNNFEAWVMVEALEVLVEGANRLLLDLSAGGYSLEVRGNGFVVVDHYNADLRRTTRSLSGGEVFLVSLALALSMASQLAELTGSSSRLESIFLDEGFGSLDQESLDIVASVLDELVDQGRTVGIVTHVKELAERIPVRFEVTKGPDTATISRRAS